MKRYHASVTPIGIKTRRKTHIFDNVARSTNNTESTFYLSGVDLSYSDSNDFLLKCTGNSNARGWGSSGANGADCEFTTDAQTMAGKIIWDSTLSSLTCKGTITDEDGNTVTVKGSDGTTYVEGTSDYTITVSSYEA